MCTILTRHASINQIKSHWKTSEGEKQAYICCMFVEGKSKTVFFPSDTLIYGICRDGTKNNNIRACEHLILGQFRMGARSAIYAPLICGLYIASWKLNCLNQLSFGGRILLEFHFLGRRCQWCRLCRMFRCRFGRFHSCILHSPPQCYDSGTQSYAY